MKARTWILVGLALIIVCCTCGFLTGTAYLRGIGQSIEDWAGFGYDPGAPRIAQRFFPGAPIPEEFVTLKEAQAYFEAKYGASKSVGFKCDIPEGQTMRIRISDLGGIRCSRGLIMILKERPAPGQTASADH